MAKFLIMQWDWMPPVILQIDGTETLAASAGKPGQPAPRHRLMRIAGALAAGINARHHDPDRRSHDG